MGSEVKRIVGHFSQGEQYTYLVGLLQTVMINIGKCLVQCLPHSNSYKGLAVSILSS